MAKGSGRFRNRKLGFKSRILLQIGVVDFEEDPHDAELEFEDEKASKGVDTGVDKEEEGEIHLQAVIASSSASVSRNGGTSTTSAKAARAFIPTPDSAGTIDEATFSELYPKGYVDPITYIRFSDTVEDATTGAVEYTMDEDDEDWLEAYNASLSSSGKAKSQTAAEDSPRRKGKGADKIKEDKSEEPSPISEDDFEQVMQLFEKVTEEKAPMAHVVRLSRW